MASLRDLGNGRWQLSVYAGADANGRPRRLTKNFTAKGIQEARRKAPGIEAKMRERRPSDVARGHDVAWLIDKWMTVKRSSPSTSPTTLQTLEYMTERIRAGIGKVKLERLQPATIEAFYDELRRSPARRPPNAKTVKKDADRPRLSESTVHHYHRVLRAMLRQAYRWGDLQSPVIDRVAPPSPRRRHVTLPSSQDVVKVLSAAKGHLPVLLRLYAATGARRAEVLGLRWDDLDGSAVTFERTVVEIVGRPLAFKGSLKNADEPPRRVTLDDETLAVLAAHQATVVQALRDLGGRYTDTVAMFPDLHVDSSGRTPIRPGRVTAAFTKACTDAKVKMRLHDLRHWHASQLLAAGIPIVDVADRLGHAQTSTTLDIYAHATKVHDDRAAQAIGAALQNAESPRPEPGASDSSV